MALPSFTLSTLPKAAKLLGSSSSWRRNISGRVTSRKITEHLSSLAITLALLSPLLFRQTLSPLSLDSSFQPSGTMRPEPFYRQLLVHELFPSILVCHKHRR